MSVDTFVFLPEGRLPTVAEWQNALDDAGVGVVLEDVGDLRTHTGYIPATLKGRPSGFEWLSGTVDEIFGEEPEELSEHPEACCFTTRSDVGELVCALYSAAVISRSGGGLIYDEEEDSFVGADPVFTIAREIEEQELNR